MKKIIGIVLFLSLPNTALPRADIGKGGIGADSWSSSVPGVILHNWPGSGLKPELGFYEHGSHGDLRNAEPTSLSRDRGYLFGLKSSYLNPDGGRSVYQSPRGTTMKKTYAEFHKNLTSTKQFQVIKDGVTRGKLLEVMVGERPFSYVRGGFAANNSPHNQDPALILKILHVLVGEGLISSKDVEAGIGSLLQDHSTFLLAMDYISEYLQRYKNDDWFPTHWLEINCQRLLQKIPENIKSNLTDSEKYYINYFRSEQPDLTL